MTERVIEPGCLGRASVVTASHHHTDHLDPETLRPLTAANPAIILICPEAHRKLARERSGLPARQIVGLDEGLEATIGAFRLQGVPAAHEALERDSQGHLLHLGFVVHAGPWTIYHSGDTVLYPGMEDLLRPLRIDVALLPINGRSPERRVAGNLTGVEAARLASAVGARCAIPGHYEMFEFNTATTIDFEVECRRLGQSYSVLRAGERWTAIPG
jgi:L-ascorbate metabolism protein UlaG (beta-lactamase superfamily)